MAKLHACPFCRQLFTESEATTCPDCDIPLRPLEELPPSYEAELVDPEPPEPPEYQRLPLAHVGRMRGALLALAGAGMAVCFAPWLRESAPISPRFFTWSPTPSSRPASSSAPVL